MAKVTITIEDKFDGGVKFTINPASEEILRRLNANDGATPAMTYGMRLARTAMAFSEEQGPNKILIPRVRGRSL